MDAASVPMSLPAGEESYPSTRPSMIGSLPPTPPHTDPFARSSSLQSLDTSQADTTPSTSQLDPYLLTRLSLDFDVDPPIPWPAESSTANHESAGGRGWDAQMDLSSSPSTQLDLERWARAQYLEALCMPETIYPLAHLVPTLQRLTPSPPPAQPTDTATISAPALSNIPSPSPLVPLVVPLSVLSQKYRRQLPLLLPSLLNTSTSAALPPSSGAEGIDQLEWNALRAGLAIWVGARLSTTSTGPRGTETPGRTEEEQAEKIRLDQLREEERLLSNGKRWLEGMERRETLLQIILLLLLPPPAPISSDPTASTKRPRKQKLYAGSSRVDVPKAFDQLTDRLSVWQALGTLGVDVAQEERDRDRDRDKKGKGKERALSGGMGSEVGLGGQEDERDWVGRFCENVVEKHFALTHPKLVLSFHSKALPLIPPPASLAPSLRPTPSRARSSGSKSQPQPLPPASTTTKSRTKPLARQLPSNANARDHSQAPFSLASSRTKSVSSSRALVSSSGSGSSSSALKRTSSSSTSIAPPHPPTRTGSVGPGARAGSMGPGQESKTEKLMRRSVSFTRGSSVTSTVAGAGGGSMASRRIGGGGGSLAAVGESQSQSSLIAAAAAAPRHVPASGGGLARVRKTSSDVGTTAATLATTQPLASTASKTKTLVQTTPSKPKFGGGGGGHKVLVPETPKGGHEPVKMPDFMAETPPSKPSGSGFGAGTGQGRRLFGAVAGGAGARAGSGTIREEEESLRELFVEGTDDEATSGSGSDDEMRL